MPTDAVPISVTRDASAGLWTLSAPVNALGVPVVDGDRVMLLVDGHLSAFDTLDGRQLWRSPHRIDGLEHPGSTPLTVAGPYVLVAGHEVRPYRAEPVAITCLRRADGGPAWCTGASRLSGLCADGDTVVLWWCGKDGTPFVTALDLADGSTLWRHTYEDIVDVVLVDGRVVTAGTRSSERSLTAFDARTGSEVWRRTDHPADGGLVPTAGGGVLLATDRWEGTVRLLDPATGAELEAHRLTGRRYRTRWSSDGTAAPDVWAGASGHRVRRIGLRGGAGPATFLSAYPLIGMVSDLPVAEAAGRLYGTVLLGSTEPPLDRQRGMRIVSARIGGAGPGLLTGVRWPRGIPRRERRALVAGLTAGPRHVFAELDGLGAPEGPNGVRGIVTTLVALRDGRVLWRRRARLGAPAGKDRVLALQGCHLHEHLRLLDAETGLGVEPPCCQGQPSSPTA